MIDTFDDEYNGLTLDKSGKASDPLLFGDISISLTSRLLPVKVFEYPDTPLSHHTLIVIAQPSINHQHTDHCHTIFNYHSSPIIISMPINIIQ